jgi:hypothetical protein
VIDILAASTAILNDAGFTTRVTSSGTHDLLAFEDGTVLGFLLAYDTPLDLINT